MSVAAVVLKRTAYLLLSLATGTAWFVVLVTGLSVGIGLALVVVGIPMLVGVLFATRPMADAERALARGLLDVELPPGHYRLPSEPGWWPATQVRLADPQTWKDIGFLACQFPLGILWFTVATVAISVPLGCFATPIIHAAGVGNFDAGPWQVGSTGTALAIAALGIPLTVLAFYVLKGSGAVAAAWAKLVLQTTPDPELTAQVDDARSAQARIVEAADAERRRLERDLHDGAQQRLVALSLKLGMAKSRLAADGDDGVAELVSDAHAESQAALAELRDLARGIHPAILTDRGLGPALEELASRSAVPTSVVAVPEGRLPAAVEATAYFVVAECLANVAKYGAANEATVAAREEGATLTVEVADDGRGGADPAKGSGLRGLADRAAALGGRLIVDSAEGDGTRVRAELPLAAPTPAG